VSALALAGQALRRGSRWRLLLLFLGFTTVPALLGAVPVGLVVGAPLAHHPVGGAWTGGLDAETLVDVIRTFSDKGTGAALGLGLVAALLTALLAAPWLAGAMVAEARSPRPLDGRALLAGAGEYWGRMTRLGLVGVLPLAAGVGLAAGLERQASEASLRAVTETAAMAGERWAMALGGLALFATLLTVDAGRAVLGARPRRRSAFLAWTSGTWLVLRRPLRTGLAGALGLGTGLGLALALTALRTRLPPEALPASVLLASLAAAAVGWGRAVRLAALTEVAHQDAGPREARRQARRLQKRLARAALAAAAPAQRKGGSST
jgi:hypothetical protein